MEAEHSHEIDSGHVVLPTSSASALLPVDNVQHQDQDQGQMDPSKIDGSNLLLQFSGRTSDDCTRGHDPIDGSVPGNVSGFCNSKDACNNQIQDINVNKTPENSYITSSPAVAVTGTKCETIKSEGSEGGSHESSGKRDHEYSCNSSGGSSSSPPPSGLELLLLAVSASPDPSSIEDCKRSAATANSKSKGRDSATIESNNQDSIARSRPRRSRTAKQPAMEEKIEKAATISTKEKRAAASKASRGAKKSTSKADDSQSPSLEPIEVPRDLDILRGRGGITNRHVGNMRFRDEARKLRAVYREDGVSRKEKFIYSNILVQKVKAYGGRFLEKGPDDLWYEMTEKAARKKASQVLREGNWD